MKYAYIIRGIPGSGKSTVAKKIADGHRADASMNDADARCSIHSTDDLCMVDGEYQFDAELAPARHAQNLENFKESLAMGIPCVIVDNTNVSQAQYGPYVHAARDEGYSVAFVELPHPPPLVAANRNTHGVPMEVITKMILHWEPSQHTATIDAVLDAHTALLRIERRFRNTVITVFGLGAVAGIVMTLLSQWLTS